MANKAGVICQVQSLNGLESPKIKKKVEFLPLTYPVPKAILWWVLPLLQIDHTSLRGHSLDANKNHGIKI